MKVEWRRGGDVDRGADASTRYVGAAGLIHGDAGNAVGGEILEIEGSRRRYALVLRDISRHRAAIQGHQIEFRTKPADRHSRAFIVHTVDGHAWHALDRFVQVPVAELTP